MLTTHKRYWAEVDLDAVENNYNIIKKHIEKDTKLCCVIKADAYGSGALELAGLYEKLGADYFALSNIEEALELRKGGITKPMLVLGYTPPECAKILAENDIEQTVFSLDYAKELNAYAKKSGVEVKIHIKLDSGMSRLGFSCKHQKDDTKCLDEAAYAAKLDSFIPVGVFTHFAISDEERGKEFTLNQLNNFLAATDYLKDKHGLEFKIRHCSNSAAIFYYPEAHLDMVRAGIVLYADASAEKKFCTGIKNIMSLKAVVSMVKTLKKGDFISYGCTYSPDKDITVATVPLGYADGFYRSNSNRGSVIIKGKKAPIIGRVCMDQLMVDVSDIEGVKAGDIVTVMGEDGNEKISPADIAVLNSTISNEFLCPVAKRLPRYYTKDGKILE